MCIRAAAIAKRWRQTGAKTIALARGILQEGVQVGAGQYHGWRGRLILAPLHTGELLMSKNMIRVVTRASDGTLRIKDYPTAESLLTMHTQVGIDDCSTDLGLRGLPVFKGLIGPMPEGKNIVRYESPDVFESLTKEWTAAKNSRRQRRRMQAPSDLPIGPQEPTASL